MPARLARWGGRDDVDVAGVGIRSLRRGGCNGRLADGRELRWFQWFGSLFAVEPALLRRIGGDLLGQLLPALFPLGHVPAAGAHVSDGDRQRRQPQPGPPRPASSSRSARSRPSRGGPGRPGREARAGPWRKPQARQVRCSPAAATPGRPLLGNRGLPLPDHRTRRFRRRLSPPAPHGPLRPAPLVYPIARVSGAPRYPGEPGCPRHPCSPPVPPVPPGAPPSRAPLRPRGRRSPCGP